MPVKTFKITSPVPGQAEIEMNGEVVHGVRNARISLGVGEITRVDLEMVTMKSLLELKDVDVRLEFTPKTIDEAHRIVSLYNSHKTDEVSETELLNWILNGNAEGNPFKKSDKRFFNAVEAIRQELSDKKSPYRSAWISSIASALRENMRMDATFEEVAEAVLDRIVGER